MVDLLKLMNDPEPQLLSFLEHICENLPLLGSFGEVKGEIILQLGTNYKVVSPGCFKLMQYVVASVGSKVMEMVVGMVQLEHFGGYALEYFGGPLGTALASQASQQQQEVRWASFRGLTFNEEGGEEPSWKKENVTNCISLLQNCSNWIVNGLYLNSIGETVWRSLAEVSTKGEIKFVEVKREALVLGRPADVRKV